jgi:hypothetical protein
MLAGRLASDSVPPRLTASLKIWSAFRNLNAAAWPPTMSNENVEPALVRTSFFRIDKAMSSLPFVASVGRFTGYDPG